MLYLTSQVYVNEVGKLNRTCIFNLNQNINITIQTMKNTEVCVDCT